MWRKKPLYTFPIAILTLLIRPHIHKTVIIIDTNVGPLAHFQLSKPWLVFNLRKALFIKHQHLFRRVYHSLLQSIWIWMKSDSLPGKGKKKRNALLALYNVFSLVGISFFVMICIKLYWIFYRINVFFIKLSFSQRIQGTMSGKS